MSTSRAPVRLRATGGRAAPTGLALVVLALAGLSFGLLVALESAGWLMHGARPARWSLAAWAMAFLAGWTLMTGAMMLPSSLPFLQAAQRIGGRRASVAGGFGFTGAWVAVGAAQWVALWLAADGLARLGPGTAERLAGVSLLAAAAYQASPLARSCQQACARPFPILARHWRGIAARREALAAGLHYGATCVGCCVPMILLMFVVGMHDLSWMLGLALLMTLQKHVAWGPRIARPAAIVLAAAGVAIGAGWWVVPLRSLRAICGA